MAEALVSSVLAKISSPVVQELLKENSVLGVQKQVEILATTLRSLQVFLRYADVKQVYDADVKAWVEELKHIAYDADDVLEEWRTTFQLSQLNPVASCSSHIPGDLPQYHRIANEIQAINDRLDRINRTRYGLTEIPIQQALHRRVTSSIIDVTQIHGREDDKKTIVHWLHADHSSSTSVPVFAIVGTAGFGKTTLAQLVFQQEKIKFELRIWVCVSQPFDREKVAKEIIEQATGNEAPNFVGWQALHQRLSDSIRGKRVLIVLDDVWSKDPEDWEPFRLSLNGGAQGSRVIVTTRDMGVAQMMDSVTHRLAELSEQECWLLFQRIAFVGRHKKEREALEEIAMKIAKKCKGVPLAAKTIASLMRLKHTKIEWRNVLESDIWKMQHGGSGFLPSLLLSYHDLPTDLKQCFLYCAIFPKDEIINKDMLVKLWMAQGFLGLDGDKELEIIGGGYFDDLAMRSFFQAFEHDDEGKIIACKMHDLVHDFTQFLTKTECSILENNDPLLNGEKLRHINARDIDIESLSGFKVKKIRSLILARSKPIQSKLFCQVTCLRSLDLSFSSLEKLPDEVERLFHLRYLDLSNTNLMELPETMCNLYNLQTLKLFSCYCLGKLPEGIGRLLNLRHLEWLEIKFSGYESCPELSYFPQGFGKLKHLRTLHKFVVSNAGGGCKLAELQDLNLISGELEIIGLRQVGNSDEARQAELQRKADIVSLTLNFSKVSGRMFTSEENENNMEKRMEEIIEGLKPHNDLERLKIRDYPGLAFPSWMSKMSNIVNLDLFNCPKLKALPGAISKLPSLDRLLLRSMCWSGDMLGICGFVNEESMASTSTSTSTVLLFPKLTRLELEEMHKWEEEIHEATIAPTISIIPNLQYLSILGCEKLKVIPNYLFSHNLRKLKIMCCPRLIRMPSMSNLPSLESLKFGFDVGVFSRSLTPIIESNNHHNLKSFVLFDSPHSSLPQGLNHFKSLQQLSIQECPSIDFNPEEELSSEHFPNLRKLEITFCGVLMRHRCSRVNWSNLSHISEIDVDDDVKKPRGVPYDSSSIVEPQRLEQQFLGSSNTELFPTKKSAIEGSDGRPVPGVPYVNPSWETPSTIDFGTSHLQSINARNADMERRGSEDQHGTDASIALSLSHNMELMRPLHSEVLKEKAVVHTVSTDLLTQSCFPQRSQPLGHLVREFPQRYQCYISHCVDVRADGHCGFRAIAAELHGSEDEWAKVRLNLIQEISHNRVMYDNLYWQQGLASRVLERLNCFEESAPMYHWMDAVTMGVVIASAYNVVLHTFDMEATSCYTHLPLRYLPVPVAQRKHIAIGRVHNIHFVQLFLYPHYPVPPIIRWKSSGESNEWAHHYQARIQFWYDVMEIAPPRLYFGKNLD